jgi:flagellin-like hook-associated protein FlgL
MPIVLNSNSSATSAPLNLTEAGASLKSSLERLPSGQKINRLDEDAGRLSLDNKTKSESSRNLATIQYLRIARSFLQLHDISLGAFGQIFERMATLRAMASDITNYSVDIENYSKEFVELQLQIDQIKFHRFNGVTLFASNGSAPNNDGVKRIGTYQRADDYIISYQKFGQPLRISLANAENTVSINVVNLDFVASCEALHMTKVNLAELDRQFYADRINEFAIRLFTDAMAKIADARTENGAEQNRLHHTLQSMESFYANMKAAHGRNYRGRYCSRINPLCTKQHARSIHCQHDRPSQSVIELGTHSDQMNQQMTKSFSRLQPFGVINRAHTKTFHKAKDDMSDIRPSFNNLFSIKHLVTARMSSPFNIN